MTYQENFQTTQADLKLKTAVTDQGPKNSSFSAIEQLQLFVKDEDDKTQINKILYQYLMYPNTQFAELHQAANRLGNRDLQDQNNSLNKNQDELAQKSVYCPCCGFVKQEYEIKLCHNLDDISNLGISTFLYFQTIKNLAFILIQMFLIYSIYAFVTNLIASGKFSQCGSTVSYYECSSNLDYLAISLGSKEQNPTDQNKLFYYIQAWLGVVMVLVWFITFFALKYFQKAKQIEVDSQTISASDFSLVIQNIPEDFSEKELQEQFTAYQQNIKDLPNTLKKPLIIRKFNKGKPFYLNQSQFDDEELKKLQDQQKQMINTFAQWILERQDSQTFSTTKQQRQEQYKKYQQNLQEQQKKLQCIGQKIKEKLQQQNQQKLTVAFVTLDTNHARNMVESLNPTDWSTRVRNIITCGAISHKLQLKHEGRSLDIRIQRSPEPEDIIWANIGISDFEKIKRKLITYIVTLILLGLSFAAVYGLSSAQISNKDNRYLSILISLVISLINVALSQVIRRLSLFERDYTTIKYQTSLAIKSVIAQLVNSIVVPIFANYFIKSNLYDKNGLADDIFMLGLTNAFVTPILKYFDGYYFFTRILAWHYSKPTTKLYINQPELNAFCTNIEFQTGFQYIYVVNLFLFVCFFVSLQPIITVFALLGFLLMFWTQKWSLFNRMRRPVPGNDLINQAMNQLIFLGPLIYSLGSLTWANFLPDGIPKEALVPNLIALGISVFIMVFPLNLIFSCCFDQIVSPQLKYEQNRIYFSTQYDRLNPATAQEGFKDYMKFIQNMGQKMKSASKQEQQRMAKQFDLNAQRGTSQRATQNFSKPVMNMFFNPAPRTNPALLGQQLLPGVMHRHPMFPNNGFQPPQQNFMPPPQQAVNQNPLFVPPPQQSSMMRQPMMPPQQMPQQVPQQQFGFRPAQQSMGFGFQPQPSMFQPFGFQQNGSQQSGFQPFGFPQQPFNPYNNFRR